MCAAGTASAQVDPRAEFERGQAAYRLGDYDRAIEAWQRAYDADPQPLLLYNLSQAYERLGRLQEAVDALDRYLANAAPNDPRQADARARVAALRERLSRTGIVVRNAPEGAVILVDDQSWGRAPRPDAISVPPGAHRVLVQLDGYDDFQAAVVVPEGQTIEVDVQMQPRAGGAEPLAVSTPTEERSTVLPIALMAGGGALVVGGAVIGVLALGKAQDAPSSEGDDADSARTLALVADIAMGLGLISAGIGLALFLVDGSSERPPEEPAPLVELAPWLAPAGGGAMVQGAF